MTLFHHLGIVAASGGVAAAPGMVLLTPTSITHSGTSASIGANGQVTFTAITDLTLNGIFSADFDNYMISIRSVGTQNRVYRGRFRAAGTTATGTDYTTQELNVNGTSVSPGRYTSQDHIYLGHTDPTVRSGDTIMIYGPYLAQPTATRTVDVYGSNSARIVDVATTHSLSTSYDGLYLYIETANMTGALQVYGVRS